MNTSHDETSRRPVISPQVDQFMATYEAELGVPSGFMLKLLTESDDWSFLIKLHGLAESAVATKLLEILRRPELAKPLRKLNMRTLLSFADAVGAVTGTSKKFLEALGELRNSLVHDIAKTSFRLSEWAGEPGGAARLATLMGPDSSLVAIAPTALDNYRFVLWARAISVLAELQGATAAHSAAFRAHVDAEVSRQASVEAQLTQQALQEMLAGDPGEPDEAA